MLDTVFRTVLNLTFTGSLVALVILLVRFCFARLIPKRILYVLWIVLLIRLLLPFSFAAGLSIFNAVPTPVPAQRIAVNEYLEPDLLKPSKSQFNLPSRQNLPAADATYQINPSETTKKTGLSQKIGSLDTVQAAYFAASLFWVAGVLLLLLFSIAGYIKIRSKLKTACLYQNSGLIQISQGRINLKRESKVLLSENIKGPILCGLIHPRIILPVACESQPDEKLEKILVHELCHIKRADPVWNLLFLLAVCIHFFNPLVWLCYFLFKKDMEFSCDEKVLAVFGGEARADYANTLIDFSARQNGLLNGGILSFGESNLKSRIKAIMNFKKKSALVTVLALILVVIVAAVTLTNGKQVEPANSALVEPGIQEGTTSAEDPAKSSEQESVTDMLYGAIQTPFAGFKITPDIPNWRYPVVFHENGKAGFQDQKGNVLVEATYDGASDFWKGVGKVRVDTNGEPVWKPIDVNGKLYDYDEVDGFYFGLSPVLKDGKYGFINTAGELVVPLLYDELYCAYRDEGRSTYAVRDGQFVYLNLTDGYEEVFELCDPAKAADYPRTVNLNDYQIVVANDMLIVNGVARPEGFDFPISVLQGLDFDLYTQDEKLGTYQVKLVPGDYEGEIFLSFPACDRLKPDDMPEEYYGVLKSANSGYREVRKGTNTAKYMDTVKQYLKDNQIENAPVAIDAAYEGDVCGDGVIGAVLEINDVYRKIDGDPLPFQEKWSEQHFKDGKTAFVNAMLIIDDLNTPQTYRIVKSNIWTHTDWDYKTENIGFLANLDSDDPLELLISNGYYEYRDYAVFELQ